MMACGQQNLRFDCATPDTPFEQRFMLSRPRIYKLAYRMLGNREDAEDILQETWLRAWLHYGEHNRECSFEGWVIRIASNLCLDRKRRKCLPMISLNAFNSSEPGNIDLVDSSLDPALCFLSQVVDERFVSGLETLPKHCRTTVMLLLEEHTCEEVATILRCPVGTVRSRVRRAREHLQHTLSKS